MELATPAKAHDAGEGSVEASSRQGEALQAHSKSLQMATKIGVILRIPQR